MPLAPKIIKFLSKIKYEPISHRTVYTAFDKAQTLRVPEKIVGKTLIIKINGNFALVLISAHQILDKAKFKKIVNGWRKKLGQKPVKEIGFASEAWMKKNLKGVKVGAIPPFGNLWPLARRGQRPGGGLPTFAEKSLLNQPKIIINGGDYNSSIKISPVSLKKLIPDLIIGSFGRVRE
jgi:Ala-tRNA(Pro) deacylase